MSNREHSTDSNSAVALTWDGSTAPRLVAKGEDDEARRIIELAKSLDIPIHEEPALAAALARFELGEEIPAELYLAVAKVIAFAYFLAGRTSVLDTQEA